MPRTPRRLPEEGLRPRLAHEVMLQLEETTKQTFRQWVTFRTQPTYYDEYFYEREANTEKIPLREFEDAVSLYFSQQFKMRDADKVFPRECRYIELIKEKTEGDTPKPTGFSKDDNNSALWAYYVKFNFDYYQPTWDNQNQLFSPDERHDDWRTLEHRSSDGIMQYANVLYEAMFDPKTPPKKKNPKANLDGQPQYVEILKKEERQTLSNLVKSSNHTGNYYQAPVTFLENAYIDYIKAHVKGRDQKFAHRGRDDTYNHMKMYISSSFSKDLIARINAVCPTCKERILSQGMAGKERELKRKGESKPRASKRIRTETPSLEQPASLDTIATNDLTTILTDQPSHNGTMNGANPDPVTTTLQQILQVPNTNEKDRESHNGFNFNSIDSRDTNTSSQSDNTISNVTNTPNIQSHDTPSDSTKFQYPVPEGSPPVGPYYNNPAEQSRKPPHALPTQYAGGQMPCTGQRSSNPNFNLPISEYEREETDFDLNQANQRIPENVEYNSSLHNQNMNNPVGASIPSENHQNQDQPVNEYKGYVEPPNEYDDEMKDFQTASRPIQSETGQKLDQDKDNNKDKNFFSYSDYLSASDQALDEGYCFAEAMWASNM
jgi:hypothetical protein